MTIRETVIDGSRAVAFSTGGGLDFAVLIDRSLDIGPLTWRGAPVGYVGPSGFRHPAGHDPHADGGRGLNRLFSGFLITGGLEHIRQPANGHPLHGTLPLSPGALTALETSFCEGVVIKPGFRLTRRIEAAAGGNGFTIVDVVENTASVPQRQASLYHFNIGRPALASGTIVQHGPHRRLGPLTVPDKALGSASYPVVDGGARCSVVTPTVTVEFAWDGATLPHLQLWGDLSAERGVLSVEPCTSEKLEGGFSGEEPLLAPGEKRRYKLDVTVKDSQPA
ncbi:MAG TPA: DUF4432 family protein [Reyranella sp.]|jgi:hypothetical protein|nr:DUF4432 family protein [Reyranella sp.]